MALIEQTCQDSDIDTEWLKEQILKPYNEERANQILIGEDREYTVEYEHGDTVWFVVDTDTWEKEGKIVLKIGAKVVRKIFFAIFAATLPPMPRKPLCIKHIDGGGRWVAGGSKSQHTETCP